MQLHPTINVQFEDGRYTAIIKREDNTVITDWQTLDELMKNMQDAFACHFHGNHDAFQIDLKIPSISFVYQNENHATVS
jgi:predicted RNase H-like HicB family nuclease